MPLGDDRALKTQPLRHRSRRVLPIIAIALCVIGIGAAGFVYWFLVSRFWEDTNNAYIQADSVVISPKIAGYVADVAVGDNQTVAAKQLLVRIDASSYQATFDLAEAQVAASHADIARYQADIARQESITAQKTAQAAAAISAAQLAAADADRFEKLATQGVATLQRRDTAMAQRAIMHNDVLAAQAEMVAANRQRGSLQAQLGQGYAALHAAEARLRSARADLGGAIIITPIAGIVGDKSVRTGQYVQPGTRLMTIVPTEGIYLIANFKETQLRHMRIGQPAKIYVDALDGPAIKGSIDSLAPGTGAQFAMLPPENATGNFTKIVQRVPVRVRLQLSPEQRAALRPGLSAEVEINTNSKRQN